MQRINNQTHSKEAFLYAISKMFERASYYGLRSIIVLYMVVGILKMPDSEAVIIYGWFSGSLIFSHIIGAILGDLLIGNKKAIIAGGIIQSIGAFCFCIPSIYGLYIGIFLVVLGGGLYGPNIIANFGKLYLDRTKLLDSGFTIFYLAINLGAFIGALLIGYLGEEYSWNIGFIIAGIIMLLSIIPILISKEKINEEINKDKFSLDQRIINILMVVTLVGLFWLIYEISSIPTLLLQSKLSEVSTLDIPKSIWPVLNSVFLLPLSILAIIISLAFISTRLFLLLIGLFNEVLYDHPPTAILIGVLAMTILSIILIIYNLMIKKLPLQ